MIDAPGPWGTGPFTLVEGASSLETKLAVMGAQPFTAASVVLAEERSPRVVLEANRQHWNRERGPRLERVVFVNDITPDQALERVLAGELDVVSEVDPTDAGRVEESEHARLVVHEANRVLVGIINRWPRDVPLDDARARQALNLAVDRTRLVQDGFAGHASPLAGMTPDWIASYPPAQEPYAHDPGRAQALLRESGWPDDRPLRLAATEAMERVARIVADELESGLGLGVEVILIAPADLPAGVTQLIEKKLAPPWDVFLHVWGGLSSEVPPAALHREFCGRDGAFRAGPEIPGFDSVFGELAREIDAAKVRELAIRLDRYVYEEALGLFLCVPRAVYAVNRHVRFAPYRTTLELAETEVEEGHRSLAGQAAPAAAR